MAMTFYLRGNGWVEFGRLDLAIADYGAALAINPMLAAAHAARGAAWAQAGDFERAIADYNTALEINPHDPDTRMNLAIAIQRQEEAGPRNPEFLN
jgi:lipoprotein NlpI